jgi:hypothetical protein
MLIAQPGLLVRFREVASRCDGGLSDVAWTTNGQIFIAHQ